MSHYAEIECNFQQKNEAEMVSALEEVFGKGNVEVHEEGADLYGYKGDNRSVLKESSSNYAPKCNIVIRRENVGPAANDIGYKRNSDGGYTAYVSDYDRRATFTETKRNKAMQEYSVSVAEKKLKASGYTVKRTVVDGVVKLRGSKW